MKSLLWTYGLSVVRGPTQYTITTNNDYILPLTAFANKVAVW